MFIFTRYIVAEVLKYFVVALIALTLLITVVMGIKEGQNQGLPLVIMLTSMPFMLPEILSITIPVSLLFAVSSVYGRFTGANELIALKSLGVNPMVVVIPVLIFAFFLSLGTVWIQELAATWGRPNVKRVAVESVEEIAYSMLRLNHSFSSPQFSVTVKRVEDRKLIQPTITVNAQGNNPSINLRAAEAELYTDRQAQRLNIIYRDGNIDVNKGQIEYATSDVQQYSIPITMPARPVHHRDWVAMYEIPEKTKLLLSEVYQLEQERTALDAQRLAIPPEKEKQIKEIWRLIYRLRTEPFRRFSNGFSCLCFVLIGIPVAMLWRHADVLTNFFVCFLPILAIYYPLLMIGEDLTTSGKLPPIFFWMGNTILIISGIILLRRIVRN